MPQRYSRKPKRHSRSASHSDTSNMKITVVLVHMKHCGFCEQLIHPQPNDTKSLWTHFKESLEKNPRFKVEDVENTNHQSYISSVPDHPPVNVEGYPTIYKITRGKNGKSIHYFDGGERTLPNLLSWAKHNKSSITRGGRSSKSSSKGSRKRKLK